MTSLRNEVAEIVRERGLLHLPAPVTLASGGTSEYFIDGKAAFSQGRDLMCACRALLEAVREQGVEFDAVGGLTMGADSLAHVLSVVADCQWFVVRKEPKSRGTNKLIEGAELGPGVRVLLVEDVVTTGGSIQQAYQEVVKTGARVVAAATLVDRGDVARGFFENAGILYCPLLTYRDLGIPPVESKLVPAS